MQNSYSYLAQKGFNGQEQGSASGDRTTVQLTEAAPDGVVIVRNLTALAAGTTKAGKLPAASGDLAAGLVLGLALYESMREPGVRAANSLAPVLRKGAAFVDVEGAVVAGSAAFVRYDAGTGGTQLGALRGDADATGGGGTDPTAAVVAGIVFEETLTTAGRALVRFDL